MPVDTRASGCQFPFPTVICHQKAWTLECIVEPWEQPMPRKKIRKREPEPRTLLLFQGSRSGRWYMHLNNPSDFSRRIGKNVLAAFMKCFVGADRLTTIVHLLQLIGLDGAKENSIAFNRNLFLLATLMSGSLYEFTSALQELTGTKIGLVLKKESSWQKLSEIRSRWQKQDAKEVRHQLAHHLGDKELYLKGLGEQLKNRRLQLYAATGRNPVQGIFEGALSTLTLGLSLDVTDYTKLLDSSTTDAVQVPNLLLDVFTLILRNAGIGIDDDREP